jgi:hypothetical protein
MAVEKMLRLESTNRFPLFHRHDDGTLERVPPRSAEERRRRKEQPNGVPENLRAKMCPE